MRITGRTKLAGIMGWPVTHSRSPALHNFWIDNEQLVGTDNKRLRMPRRDGGGFRKSECLGAFNRRATSRSRLTLDRALVDCRG